ncbi:hypothetical protein [Streptosporangium saharense]|uniref:Thiaminase-2/PQQC domain-containing protein n=1 Tax=Streptosporangium saharense TaxID=1706840 RepID=A0A7W7QLL6_9ACTN|nr:hypothetical protein [Streptosporangium saharense]MBB4915797.1 hypothetical protein [Streptosporangium saharense]
MEVDVPDGVSRDGFLDLLGRLDGSRTIEDLERETGLDGEVVREVVEPAVGWGLIDEGAVPVVSPGTAALARLEGLLNDLLEDLVLTGPFWRRILERPQRLHPNVFFGFGLENWFLLSRESGLGSAVQTLAENADLRQALDDFDRRGSRHDDVAVRAFRSLGATRGDLLRARPLPTTAALIKMLSWWARTDPLFFVATLGVIEERLEADNEEPVARCPFLAACETVGLTPGFVEPMRAHARAGAARRHGALSRALFARMPGIDEETERSWQAKAHLFMETYAGFCDGVLDHYSDPHRPLLRLCG